jgi:hypothetical protein
VVLFAKFNLAVAEVGGEKVHSGDYGYIVRVGCRQHKHTIPCMDAYKSL